MLTCGATINQTQEQIVEQVVYDFYEAIKKKQCDKARRLQPNYSLSRCKETVDVDVQTVKTQFIDSDGKASVKLELRYRKANNANYDRFAGQVVLVKIENQWLIKNYRPAASQDQQSTITSEDQKAEHPQRSSTQGGSGQRKPFHNNDSYEERPLTFGSERIIQSCWTPAELNGSAADKKIVALPAANHTPVARTSPRYPNSPLPTDLQQSIRYVEPDPDKKLVALTFDLCEQTNEKSGYDADIVNYLRQHKIKSTFFAGGQWMQSHRDKAMQLMADPLFEIGNHAWTHGNLRVLRGREMEEQIMWTQSQYELLWENLKNQNCVIEAGSQEMHWIPRLPATFRFPYGTCNAESLNAVNQAGLAAVQWNIVTGDPVRKQTATAIAKIILDQIKPGSIIIAHANGRGWNTAAALPLFIPKLRQMGYEFVTVSELLRSGRAVAADTCYELRPNDNLHYDKIFGKGT